MNSELKRALASEVERGGRAYIRNLAAAEQATLHGQFNVAKILRAAAQSQRIMAMEAARLLGVEDGFDAQEDLSVILQEIGPDKNVDVPASVGPAVIERLAQSVEVRARLRHIVQRALASLENNSDVLESDIAQIKRLCAN